MPRHSLPYQATLLRDGVPCASPIATRITLEPHRRGHRVLREIGVLDARGRFHRVQAHPVSTPLRVEPDAGDVQSLAEAWAQELDAYLETRPDLQALLESLAVQLGADGRPDPADAARRRETCRALLQPPAPGRGARALARLMEP